MPLENDIVERVQRDFCVEDFASAIKVLSDFPHGGRTARCIVAAAKGSLAELRRYAKIAEDDFRDVIRPGEYDGGDFPVRDLCVSFLIDCPENMWIREVARMMHSRGFILSSLETINASFRPFGYTENTGEATAKFVGSLGEFQITKKNDQWILHGDPDDLELYGLDQPLISESKFCDEVSCYLLAKMRPIKPLI